MRFVTWNMGRSRDTHEAAWHYLLSCLKPDVACVQEVLVSADRLAAAEGSMVWSKSRPGGTGVFVRRGVSFERVASSLQGSYIAAISVSALDRTFLAFSVHVGPESWKNQEALERWLVEQMHVGPFVVGGDFNTSRSYSEKHRAYLARLVASGVHDCHWSKHGRETPSFWGRQSRAATYQNDHFFTSQSFACLVRDCWVADNPLTRKLSDHGPVVLDLESGAG